MQCEYIDSRRSFTDLYERDVDVVLETSNPAQLPLQDRYSADDVDDDDDDDFTASARSRSPSSDVENILDAVGDTTATYFGDFTLRRVFSLEEELVNHRAAAPQSGVGSDSTTRKNRETTARTTADSAGGLEGDRQCDSPTTWTLPLARRLTPKSMGGTLTTAFRRFNGIAQGRTARNEEDHGGCLTKPPDNSVAINNRLCPVNVADYLCVTPLQPDAALSSIASTDTDSAMSQAVPSQTLCTDRNNADASTTKSVDPADDSELFVERKRVGCPARGDVSKATIDCPLASAVSQVSEVKPAGIRCGASQVAAGSELSPSRSTAVGSDFTQAEEVQQAPPSSTPLLLRRCSSNRDSSRPPPPIQTRSPRRRSSAPSRRTSVDAVAGLMTLGVSRTSSCEVFVDDDDDDDDARLSDIIVGRGVTRRSSCSSSYADDGDSTTGLSETDSSAAYFDLDDLVTDSLLDRLLMRLRRSTPPQSPSSRGRPLSTQISSSSDEDEEADDRHRPGVTVRPALMAPAWINRRHCSLLSSLDDVTSDSDFELGSSLSQLTSGKSPHHPSAAPHNHDRRRGSASASCTDLPRLRIDQLLLDNCRNLLLQSSGLSPPNPVVAGTTPNDELRNSATSELTAPITQTQSSQTNVARTSAIPEF